MAYHLGPDVDARLAGHVAHLTWPGGSAVLTLPEELAWTAHSGETDPVLGWYSPSFGRRVPATTLLGTGRPTPGDVLSTVVTVDPPRR